jgi:hypothetical protein
MTAVAKLPRFVGSVRKIDGFTFIKTEIKGHRVEIHKSPLDGIRLFITTPNGENVFAHKISGDAYERAIEEINKLEAV